MDNTMNQPVQMGQPGMMQQPMMPMNPPKQPMDSAKKKKIILGVSLGVGGLVVLIVAIVVISIVSKVDYGETYRLTQKLEDKVDELAYNYGCKNVVSYVTSDSTSVSTYDGYASECLETMSGMDELLKQVRESAGVKRNKDLQGMFESFETELGKILPDQKDLAERLELYKAWHKFSVLVDDLSTSSSDAEVQTAANALIESGNEILKKYGEGWLEKTLAYTNAYQVYYNTSYSASNKSELRVAMENAKTAQSDYSRANKPDIKALGGLNFDDAASMKKAFTTFSKELADLYEENYNYGSGDCTEFFGEVVCE